MSGTTCTSCGAAIAWAVTEAGKDIPIDGHPVEPGNGNLAVVRAGDGVLHSRVITKDRPLEEGELVGRSHFATCPDASKHRRPRH